MGSSWVAKKPGGSNLDHSELLHSRVSGRCGWELRRFRMDPGHLDSSRYSF
jgi:hypothetical protein